MIKTINQQAKDTQFRNRPKKRLPFFASIAGTTGMNMSVENNMLLLLCQKISVRLVAWFIDFFPFNSISLMTSICRCRSKPIMMQ